MPCVAFCNEDGKRLDLPVNWLATGMWHDAQGGGYGVGHRSSNNSIEVLRVKTLSAVVSEMRTVAFGVQPATYARRH
jgi:hypothetical protein